MQSFYAMSYWRLMMMSWCLILLIKEEWAWRPKQAYLSVGMIPFSLFPWKSWGLAYSWADHIQSESEEKPGGKRDISFSMQSCRGLYFVKETSHSLPFVHSIYLSKNTSFPSWYKLEWSPGNTYLLSSCFFFCASEYRWEFIRWKRLLTLGKFFASRRH